MADILESVQVIYEALSELDHASRARCMRCVDVLLEDATGGGAVETREPAPVEPVKRKPSPVERKQVVSTSPKGGGGKRSAPSASGPRPSKAKAEMTQLGESILRIISDHPQGITPKAVAERLGLHPQMHRFRVMSTRLLKDQKYRATGMSTNRMWFPNGQQ